MVTLALIAINVVVFLFLQHPTDPETATEFLYRNAVIPCEVTTGQPLSLAEIRTGTCSRAPARPVFPDKDVLLAGLMSMFLHGGLLHLAGNMWFLWIFGNNVEEAYGRIGYLLLYLAAGIAGTAAFVLVNPDTTVPLVGASGAIAGVLGAYLVLYPNALVLSLVLVFFVPVPAFVFLLIWFVSQFAVVDTGVAWQAHVVGFVFGALVTIVLRPRLEARLARIAGALRRPYPVI